MSGAARKRSFVSLWLIVAVTTAPVVASYLFYYLWPPADTTNYGELLDPIPLPRAPLVLADGTPFELAHLKGKWILVMVDAARCDAYCEKKLFYLRQLRLAQGKNMDRVERAWLISDAASPRAEAAARFEGTWLINASAELLGLFPAAGALADHIFVIDPLGNLMMRYPRDPDPERMIKDLSRLLKVSRIG